MEMPRHSAQPGRRVALLLLAGGTWPALARAQTTQPSTVSPTQPSGPAPAAPTVTLPGAPVVAPTAPARSAAPAVPAAGIDRTKSYYVFFDQTIDTATMLKMRQQLTNLVDAGVSDITIVISSPGGQIGPVLLTYSFVRALPATIKTPAQGFVASAATLLFLAGDQRTADRNARFLFHPSQSAVNGLFGEQQLRESQATFDSVVDMTTQIYRDRTELPGAEIERFGRETVIYTADQARACGVVQDVADLRIPGEGKAKIMFLD